MAIRYLSGINVDSNTLFVDSTNNRVGIGTGSPTYKLDVVGEGRTSDAFMAGGAINIDNNLAIQISSAGAGTQRWIGINKNNGYGLIIGYVENAAALSGVGAYIRQVTSDPIHFLVNNATTAMSIVNSGKVGIGTTGPAAKLTVVGADTIIGQTNVAARFSDDLNSTLLISHPASTSATATITGNEQLGFATGSVGNIAERMRITTAGNVLIGTTTDAGQTFQVVGSSSLRRASGTSQTNIVEFKNTTNDAYLTVTGIGTTSDVATWTNGSMVIEAVPFSTGSMILSAYTGSLIIQTGRTNRLEIGSSGTVRLNNYGSGSKTGTATYGLAVDSSGNIIEVTSTIDGSGTANYVTKWQDSNTLTDSVIYDNGTNVGIGTTAPAAKLDVVGVIRYGDNGSSIGALSYGTGVVTLEASSANTHVSIIPSGTGNVGVATLAPSQKLHVSGNIRVTGAYYDSNNDAGSSGQVLSSTGSGTDWITPATTTATSLYDLLPAARVAYNWVGQVVNDTWTTVFTKNDSILTTGTWMVKMYVNDFGVGGGHYQYVYSGIMTWDQGTVNQTGEAAFSEVYLHRMGHAANASVVYLRTAESGAAGGNIGYFQIKGNYSNTANQTIQFQFVKIF